MTPLAAQLQAYTEDFEQHLPDLALDDILETPIGTGPVRALQPVPSGRRRWIPALVAAALVVGVLGGGLWLATRTTDLPVPPIEGGVDLGWKPVEVATFHEFSAMHDVAALSPDFTYAAGSVNHVAIGWGSDQPNGTRVPAMWTSPDAGSWNEAALDPTVFPEPSSLNTIERAGPGLVIGGTSPNESGLPVPTVWLSADGSTWARIVVAEARGEVHAIATTARLRAFGNAGSRPAIWRSQDGMTWFEDTLDTDVEGRVTAAAGTGISNWVAFVDTIDRSGSAAPPTVLSFDGDGRWTAASTLPDDAAHVLDATWSAGRFVAVGDGEPDDTERNATIWISRDGVTWERVLDGAGNGSMWNIVAADRRLAVMGSTGIWMAQVVTESRSLAWERTEMASSDEPFGVTSWGRHGFAAVGRNDLDGAAWRSSDAIAGNHETTLTVADEPGTTATTLANGRPVFVVVDERGGVAVVDAISTHLERNWVGWCPSAEIFRDLHGSYWDRTGRYGGGPGRSDLAIYAIDVARADGLLVVDVGGYHQPGYRSLTSDAPRGPWCDGTPDTLDIHPFFGVE